MNLKTQGRINFKLLKYLLKMGLATGCFFSMGFYLLLVTPPGNILLTALGLILLFIGACFVLGTVGMLKGIRMEDLNNLEVEYSNK